MPEPAGVGAPAIAVYVHWPFCLHKCPYCDFNSHVRERIDSGAWRRALLAELADTAARLGPRTVHSVFFGGGTPSLMAPADTAAVLDAIAGHWAMAEDCEITLEANPTSVEAGRFRDLAAAGVNRVSIGVQALDDASLRALGRQHGVAEARAALESARGTFPRWSFDLIYARPRQTLEDWRAELDEALTMAGGHLSLYQLTIEDGTAFAQAARRGLLTLPDEDTSAAMYELTQERCAIAGLPAYEISNHAAPGQESQHNLAYWRYGEYAGLGPGAHGRVMLDGRRHATARIARPEAWIEAVSRQGHGSESESAIDADDRARELLMMGLRLKEGIALSAFEAETGRPLTAWLERQSLQPLLDEGLLVLDAERLRASARGLPVLNGILAALL